MNATRRVLDRFVAFDGRRTNAATTIVSGEAARIQLLTDAHFELRRTLA